MRLYASPVDKKALCLARRAAAVRVRQAQAANRLRKGKVEKGSEEYQRQRKIEERKQTEHERNFNRMQIYAINRKLYWHLQIIWYSRLANPR